MNPKSKMITLKMAERIFGVFPSSLVSTNGAQTAAKPLALIDAKEDAVYLTSMTVMVVARLAVRQLPRQGPLRDTIGEDRRQKPNGGWITASAGALGLHLNNVCDERHSGSRFLAVTDGPKWVRCVPNTHMVSCWCLPVLLIAIARRRLIIPWDGGRAQRESVS